MLALRDRPWFIKLNNPEFWPMWLYYIPVWIQHFWLSLKLRNVFFFLGTNPAIKGFILSDSKYRTLQLVPEKYRPKTVLIHKEDTISDVLNAMKENKIAFPVILKPDIGFRGLGVRKIENATMLETTLATVGADYIIQEFICCPLELGIFYYRYPDERNGHIPSITIKEFLKVTGNGKDSLAKLVLKNQRAILLKEKIKLRFEKEWDEILENGQILVLECIGNHNKGTKFINGNALLDNALLKVFDELNHQMNGFYFGRFDIKASSIESIKNRNYKILEVNGVGGEPTHIYDPGSTFFGMLRDLCFVWRVAAKIASINFNFGIKKPTYREAHSRWKEYTSYKTELAMED